MRTSTFMAARTVLSLAVLLGTPFVSAQDGGWYGALSLGKSRADIDNRSIAAAVRASGPSVSTLGTDDNDTAWKLAGGYSFTERLALEASYVDFGEFGFAAGLLPPATLRGSADLSGYGLDLVGSWPLGNRLAFLGRIGINNTRVEQDFSGLAGNAFADGSERGVNENYGIGLQYDVNDAFSVRTEFTRYGIDGNRIIDDKVDTLTLGFVYLFGARAAVAAEPAPQAPPTPAAAPPVPIAVTLEANTLFDFDKSDLKPEGRQALDRLLRDMEGLDYDVVIVTGHTDRIGTRNYNLALSERRAETVRAWLVQGGVPQASITARGVNSDQPVTMPQQCTGPVNDALKACLQPDRRVVVEVSGTRDAE